MQVSHAHSDANDLHERAFAPEARLNRPPAGTKLPPHLWWRRSAWRLSQPAGMRKRHACVIADGALAQIARKHTRVRGVVAFAQVFACAPLDRQQSSARLESGYSGDVQEEYHGHPAQLPPLRRMPLLLRTHACEAH